MEIDWDRFFGEFERANLAFVYRNVTVDGELDDFHEFINRSSVPGLTPQGVKIMAQAHIKLHNPPN